MLRRLPISSYWLTTWVLVMFNATFVDHDYYDGVSGLFLAPDLPSPQDWILVMERANK